MQGSNEIRDDGCDDSHDSICASTAIQFDPVQQRADTQVDPNGVDDCVSIAVDQRYVAWSQGTQFVETYLQ